MRVLALLGAELVTFLSYAETMGALYDDDRNWVFQAADGCLALVGVFIAAALLGYATR